MSLTRRDLLKLGIGATIGAGALAGLARFSGSARSGAPRITKSDDDSKWVRRARYYEKLSKGRVRCTLCPKTCAVGPAERGFCGVRENRDGEYYTLVYGRAASVNIDPIEKKPLCHVLPGSPIFSFSTAGCNMECKNCQNWQLSQSRPEQLPAADLPPDKLVEAARKQGCSLIAGTYAEPVVFAEYLLDVAREGNKRGLRTTMISAGYITRQPLLDLCRELAAIKIDLKSMREDFYRKVCAGALKPVLDAIELVRNQGVWLEIVYLVIPTLNDSEREIRDLARWVKTHVGPEVPLHFSRFHPYYRLKNLPPTPYETLDRCYKIARAEGLHYVYVGNLPHPAQSTFCPKCGKLLIRREGFQIGEVHLRQGRCEYCQHPIPGIWS
jgi:pyruvate formate lyase activating enzyme